MKLGHIELFVRDPEASLAFYRDILGCEVVAVQAGGHFIWVKLGHSELLLRKGHPGPAAATYGAASSALVLYASDVPARVAAMSAMGVVFRKDDEGGGEPAFTDPDGHWFQLANPEGP